MSLYLTKYIPGLPKKRRRRDSFWPNIFTGQILGMSLLMLGVSFPVLAQEGDIATDSGLVAFTQSEYTVNEGDRRIVVNVARTDGSYGTLTVEYVTSDGPPCYHWTAGACDSVEPPTPDGNEIATANNDYVAADNSLTWADGDTNEKTLTVELINDTLVEPNQTFNILLLDSFGQVGTINTATVTIINDDQQQSANQEPTGSTEPQPPKRKECKEGIDPKCNGAIVTGKLTVNEGISVSRLEINGDITNQGLISNSLIKEGAIVKGGILTGNINNQGTIADVDFRGNWLTGGILANKIVVTNSKGIIGDVKLAAGTSIKGGRLAGKISGDCEAPAVLEQVEILRRPRRPIIDDDDDDDSSDETGPRPPRNPRNPRAQTELSCVQIGSDVVLNKGIAIGNGVFVALDNPLAERCEGQEGLFMDAGEDDLEPESVTPNLGSNFCQLPASIVMRPDVVWEPPPECWENPFEPICQKCLEEPYSPECSGNFSKDLIQEGLFGKGDEEPCDYYPELCWWLDETALQPGLFDDDGGRPEICDRPPYPRFDFCRQPDSDNYTLLDQQSIAELSLEQITDFTATQISEIQVEAFKGLSAEQFKALNPTEVKKMSSFNLTGMLVNLDPEQIKPEDVKTYLPTNWDIDLSTGELKVPAGNQVQLPKVQFDELPQDVEVPTDIPNLNVSLSLGSANKTEAVVPTVAEEINQTLTDVGFSDFAMKQENGIVKVTGTGQATGVDLTFVPDTNHLVQAPKDAKPGVTQTKRGDFVLTTHKGKRLTLVSSVNPKALTQVMPNVKLNMTEYGENRLEIPDLGRTVSGTIDPFVEPAPKDKAPGVYFKGQAGVDEQMEIVYEDGSMQRMQPAIQNRADLITAINANQELGQMNNIQFQANGEILLTYNENTLKVTPTFDVKRKTSSSGQATLNMLSSNQVEFITETGEAQVLNVEVVGSSEDFITMTSDQFDAEDVEQGKVVADEVETILAEVETALPDYVEKNGQLPNNIADLGIEVKGSQFVENITFNPENASLPFNVVMKKDEEVGQILSGAEIQLGSKLKIPGVLNQGTSSSRTVNRSLGLGNLSRKDLERTGLMQESDFGGQLLGLGNGPGTFGGGGQSNSSGPPGSVGGNTNAQPFFSQRSGTGFGTKG